MRNLVPDGVHGSLHGHSIVRHAAAAVEESAISVPSHIELNPDVSLLKPSLRDRPGTLAAIRLRRGEAERIRTMLETGSPQPH